MQIQIGKRYIDATGRERIIHRYVEREASDGRALVASTCGYWFFQNTGEFCLTTQQGEDRVKDGWQLVSLAEEPEASDDDITVALYLKHAGNASYFYADDSTREWGAGDRSKSQAFRIYRENPELQSRIRAEHNELWSLESEIRSWDRKVQLEKGK